VFPIGAESVALPVPEEILANSKGELNFFQYQHKVACLIGWSVATAIFDQNVLDILKLYAKELSITSFAPVVTERSKLLIDPNAAYWLKKMASLPLGHTPKVEEINMKTLRKAVIQFYALCVRMKEHRDNPEEPTCHLIEGGHCFGGGEGHGGVQGLQGALRKKKLKAERQQKKKNKKKPNPKPKPRGVAKKMKVRTSRPFKQVAVKVVKDHRRSLTEVENSILRKHVKKMKVK